MAIKIKNSIKDKVTDPRDIIKPTYTISELAHIMGYTRQGMRLVLLRMRLPLHLHGSRIIVYLSSIQEQYPELYNSILEAYGIIAQLNELRDIKNEVAAQQLKSETQENQTSKSEFQNVAQFYTWSSE